VTGEGTRLTAAIVAAVFATGLLVACGGSDSTSTESTSTSQETVPEGNDQPSANKDEPKGPQKDAGSQAKNQGSSNQGDSAGSGSAAVATPLRVSGGGSEQFRVKGGDNSIQEYGSERDESELQAAAETVHGFYVARAEENWVSACSYLTKSIVEQLEKLTSQSAELRGKGCGVALHAFTRPLPASVRRETTVVEAGSLRQEGDQAFLIYYGPEKIVYAMPLDEENGKLRVGALAGNPLN
jgi:hypothetical protein